MKIFKDLEDLFWKNTLQEHEVKNSVNKFYLESTKLSVPFDRLSPRFEISDVLKERLNTPKSDFVAAKFGPHHLKKNVYGKFSYLKSFEIWKSILSHKDTSLANFFQQTASEYSQSIEQAIFNFKEYIEDKNLFIRKKRKIIFKIINENRVDRGELQKQANNSKVRAKIYELLFNEILKNYNLTNKSL